RGGAGRVGGGRGTGGGEGELERAVLARRAEPPPVPRLTVLQALPKGDRGELAVETMTEVGVDVIVPWAAERCVVQWRGDRGDRALARWRSAGPAAGTPAPPAPAPGKPPPARPRRGGPPGCPAGAGARAAA